MSRESLRLRRAEGGGQLRPTAADPETEYDSALRSDFFYVPQDLVDEDVPLQVTVLNHSSVRLAYDPVDIPADATWGVYVGAMIVRSPLGVPLTNLDGVPVARYSSTPVTNGGWVTLVEDGLPPGSWQNYALFVRYSHLGNTYWVRLGSTSVLMPEQHGYGEKFWNSIPEWYRRQDTAGVLRQVTDLLGFEYDIHRTYAASLGDVRNVDEMGAQLLDHVCHQLGTDTEGEEADRHCRSLCGNLVHLRKTKGTSDGLAGYLTSFSGFKTTTYTGLNELLTANESEARYTVGTWTATVANTALTRELGTGEDNGPGSGAGYFRVTNSTAATLNPTMWLSSPTTPSRLQMIPVKAAQQYKLTASMKNSAAGKTAQATLNWHDSDGALLSTNVEGMGAIGTAWGRQATAWVTAPANAAYLNIAFNHTAGTALSGMNFNIHKILLARRSWRMEGIPIKQNLEPLSGTNPGNYDDTNYYESARLIYVNLYPQRVNLAKNSDFQLNNTPAGAWEITDFPTYDLLPFAYTSYDDIVDAEPGDSEDSYDDLAAGYDALVPQWTMTFDTTNKRLVMDASGQTPGPIVASARLPGEAESFMSSTMTHSLIDPSLDVRVECTWPVIPAGQHWRSLDSDVILMNFSETTITGFMKLDTGEFKSIGVSNATLNGAGFTAGNVYQFRYLWDAAIDTMKMFARAVGTDLNVDTGWTEVGSSPYVPVAGRIEYPAVIGNDTRVTRTALGSLTTYDVAIRVRFDQLGTVQRALCGWESTHAQLNLTATNNLSVMVRSADAAVFIGAAASSAAVPGLTTSSIVWLRGRVTIANAQCEYWYSFDDTYRYEDVVWTALGTPQTGGNAGHAPLLTSSATTLIGTYSSGAAGFDGAVYSFIEIDSGAITIRMDASIDVQNAAATSFISSSEHTINVFRSGSPATELIVHGQRAAELTDKSHVKFPGTANNLLSLVFSAFPTDASTDWRCEFERPPTPGAGVNYDTSSHPSYIRFSSSTVQAIFVNSSSAFIPVSVTYATLAGQGFPAVGQWVQMRGTWDATTDTLSLYWRAAGTDLNSDTGWTLAASTTSAGSQIRLTDTNWSLNSTNGAFAAIGRARRWIMRHNGATIVDVNIDANVTDPNAATFTATTGQTVTVTKTGSPATALVLKTPFASKAVMVGTTEPTRVWVGEFRRLLIKYPSTAPLVDLNMHTDLIEDNPTQITSTTGQVWGVNNGPTGIEFQQFIPGTWYMQVASDLFPVTDSTAMSASITAFSTSIHTKAAIRYQWYTEDNVATVMMDENNIPISTVSPLVLVGTSPTRVEVRNAIPPAEARFGRVIIESKNTVEDNTTYFQKALIENGAVPGPYFDGTSTDGAFGDFFFIGTPHQSYSAYYMNYRSFLLSADGSDRITTLMKELLPPLTDYKIVSASSGIY